MPYCYLLAVCTGSSLDEDTSSFSLFNLVERIEVSAASTARGGMI
jgi:hypothetical protein